MKVPNCFGSFQKEKYECQNCEYQEECKQFIKREEILRDLEVILQTIKEVRSK
jgi:hypothetical protein